MAVHPGMVELVSRVKRLVGQAEAADDSTCLDEDVLDALSNHRQYHRYSCLESIPSYLPGGQVQYKEFESRGIGDWADSVQIVDSKYNALTTATADLKAGRWTFADSYNQTLLISGEVYDIHGAAADLLDQLAARLKGMMDVEDKDLKMKRSQQFKQAVDIAAICRSKQKVTWGTVRRSDVG